MKLILHNSISINGSLTNFEPNMGLHYKIAGSYKPCGHLIGSNTIIAGIELYGQGVPKERKGDFKKQKRDASLPFWFIPDSKGSLQGLLHTCRQFEFCRDVIILISESTPDAYIKHLQERNYDFLVAGTEKVNFKTAFELISEKYNVRTILTDTGSILGNLLLNQGFVNEISLLIHPVLIGIRPYPVFSEVTKNIRLILQKSEIYEEGFVHLVYKVEQ